MAASITTDRGIKIIMYKAKVDYSCVTIVQEPGLKERLEELDINRYGVTLASVDERWRMAGGGCRRRPG